MPPRVSRKGTFGVHPGQRRDHIKGICAAGEFKGGIGHNLPQEAPQAFAQAVADVGRA